MMSGATCFAIAHGTVMPGTHAMSRAVAQLKPLPWRDAGAVKVRKVQSLHIDAGRAGAWCLLPGNCQQDRNCPRPWVGGIRQGQDLLHW